MLRNHSDFDADLEDLAHRVIGCCIAVHRELGAGLVEAAYARAVRVELTASNISYESEKRYPIVYRGKPVYSHRLDLVIEQRLVVELKCG
jgi:GxxExxY protein